MADDEKNFKTFFAAMTDMIFVCDKQGNIEYVNHAAEIKLGYLLNELTGKSIFDIHPPEKRHRVTQIINDMFAGKAEACPLPLIARDGTQISAETRLWLGTWNGGDCIFVISKDQSKEHEMLRKFNALFDNNPLPMTVSELPERIITEVNNAFLETTGYDKKEIIGKTADDLGLYYDKAETQKLSRLLSNKTIIKDLEIKIRSKDWRIVDGLLSGEVIENKGKKNFISVITDITERKNAEKMLIERDQLLSKLTKQLPGAVYQLMMRTDGTMSFPFANDGIAHIFELTPEDVMFDAKPALARIYPEDYDRFMASIRQSFKNASVWDHEYRVVLPEKGLRWIKGTAQPEKLMDGSVLWHGYMQDIHEQKLMQESLSENEGKYRFLIENSHDIIYTLNDEGIFDFVSPSWTLLLGHHTNQVIGHSFVPFIHPDDVPAFLKFLEKVIASGQPQDGVEYRIMHSDGNWFWHTSSATPLKNDDNKTIGFVGIAKDITRLKTAENQIKQTEQDLEHIFSVNLDMICITDADGTFIKINKTWEEVLGYTLELLKNKRFLDLVHPDDIPKTFEAMLKLKDQDKGLNFANRYKSKDGTYKHIEWRSYAHGNFVYTSARDITSRIVLKQALYNQNQQFELAVKGSNDGIWDWNLITNEVYLSPKWKQQLGYQDDEISNSFSSFESLIHKEDRQKVIAKINQYLREDIGSYEVQFRMRHKDGSHRWIWARGEAVRDSSGKAVRMAGSHTEITEKKEKQDQIEYLSFHDQLTGLYNRRFFETELKRLDTTRNLPLSLLMLDVNGLKLTNDAFGRETGDELLKKSANIIKEVSRDDDIVCRIGGDEFVFILPSTNELQARALIKRIKETAAKAKVSNVPVSISCGVGTKSNMQKKTGDIYKLAEDDMFRDKISARSGQRHETIRTIIKTLFEKAPAEEHHSSQVSRICEHIGVAMGLSQSELKDLVTSAVLHDIGKIAINTAVLEKKGPLDESEWLEVKKHPEVGSNILRSVDVYAPLADIVLAHHEKWDGSGYPNGLKEDAIPFQARIIAIADAFDSMTKERPYKKIMSKKEAIAELKRCSGTQFDPRIVHVFIEKVLNVTDNA